MMDAPTDRYASPAALAFHSGAPERLCAIVFRAAGDDREMIKAIRSTCMKPALLTLKRATIYVARTQTGTTWRVIAQAMNCDHSTALHSFRVASALVNRDRKFKAMCERIAG